jgi:hypothetical protein
MKKKKDHKNVVQYSALLDTSTKDSPVHIAPTCAGSDHFGSYVYSIFLHFYKRLFQGLELMISWSQLTRQQLYHCTRAPLLGTSTIKRINQTLL